MVASAEGQDDVELRIHRILFNVPPNQDQKRLAQRLSDAEQLRGKFTRLQEHGDDGARRSRRPLRQPRRPPPDQLARADPQPLARRAHDEELLPATIGENGVELWAVCGRKLVKAADSKRETAQNELRQKEFEILSKKHLKDLRTDAHIEYR